jgi:magnesium chelatase subunit D
MVDFGGRKKLSTGSAGRATGRPDRPSFAAIVGQEELKTALLAVGANDELDGLLVRGEKGTAKSTAVRGLVDCLPTQQAVADCPFGCAPDDPSLQCADCRERTDPPVETRRVPLVTLPLGATREQVVGTLSVADALEGSAEFDPGLLARAHRGLLYVDEVNLLDDHLVDVLLDAAASGVNRVERDGVSRAHPAEFTLVGTMNPEEGDLRPQLRDRFALQATVTGCADLEDRVAVIDTALGSEAEGPENDDSDEPARRLRQARDLLGDVELPPDFKRDIAELCRDAGVDGHRADIATARTARTLAALDGRTRVIEGDLRRAAEFALPHRLQSRPFEDPPDPDEILDDHFDDGDEEEADGDDEQDADRERENEADDGDGTGDSAGSHDDGSAGEDGADCDGPETEGDDEQGAGTEESEEPDDTGGEDTDDDRGSQPQPAGGDRDDGQTGEADGDDGDGDGAEDESEQGTPLLPGQQRAGIGDGAGPEIDPSAADEAGGAATRDGSRVRTRETRGGSGARVRSERASADESIDPTASVRAAATRGSDTVQSRDLRQSVRAETQGALVVFALDASASMRPAMRAAKGVAIDLLEDAYQQRDEVAVCTFAGEESEVVLPPTDSVTLAARHLKDLPTGDRTPLPAGLRTAADVLDRADPEVGVVVLVTDGRANGGDSPVADTRAAARDLAKRDAHLVVVDAAPDDRSTLTGDIVDITDGDRVSLDALSPDTVERAVDDAADHQTD